MSSVTFDTLKYVEKLEKAGVPRAQAVAMAEAQKDSLGESMDAQLASKNDIQDIRIKLAEYDGQFTLIKWMLGVLMAGVLSLVLKSFF